MARILVVTDDLLFGSRLEADLAGHEVRLSPLPGTDAELLIADLTIDAEERIAALTELAGRPPTLAYYSHVDTAVRERAKLAGLELVVPRSRIAREAAALATQLLAPRA